jgi:hypothetical protein
MTVNIDPTAIATVEINDAGTVVVAEPTREVVEVVTVGPQGPSSPVGEFGDIPNVDTSAVVDKSVLYYDAASGMWRGDDIQTVLTLTDGGAF